MDKWYKANPGCSIQHAGEVIEADKKIFLPEDLAGLHNSLGDQLVVTTEPANLEETGVKAEWLTLQEQKASKTTTRTYRAGEETSPVSSSSKSSTTTS